MYAPSGDIAGDAYLGFPNNTSRGMIRSSEVVEAVALPLLLMVLLLLLLLLVWLQGPCAAGEEEGGVIQPTTKVGRKLDPTSSNTHLSRTHRSIDNECLFVTVIPICQS